MATKNKNTETCDCPKCGGSGDIPAFSGIAQGICFTCNGSGRVRVGRFKPAPPLSDYSKKCCEWILNATPDQIAKLSWSKLYKSLSIACGGPENRTYPNLKSVWEEKFRDAFNAAQEDQLQKLYANR